MGPFVPASVMSFTLLQILCNPLLVDSEDTNVTFPIPTSSFWVPSDNTSQKNDAYSSNMTSETTSETPSRDSALESATFRPTLNLLTLSPEESSSIHFKTWNLPSNTNETLKFRANCTQGNILSFIDLGRNDSVLTKEGEESTTLESRPNGSSQLNIRENDQNCEEDASTEFAQIIFDVSDRNTSNQFMGETALKEDVQDDSSTRDSKDRPMLEDKGTSPRAPVFGYNVTTDIPDFQTAIGVSTFACGHKAVCNDSLSKYIKSSPCILCSNCSCDDQCGRFGDCCTDVALKTATRQTPEYKCVNRTLMVQSCPADPVNENSQENYKRCVEADEYNPDESIPVSDLSTNTTYRNVFCAKCNGVKNITFWNMKVLCPTMAVSEQAQSREEAWVNVKQSGKCVVLGFPPVGIKRRKCSGEAISSCLESLSMNTTSSQLCLKANGPPVIVSRKLYKNVFCAVCNGETITRGCRPSLRTDELNEGDIGLNVLLDFNPKPEVETEIASSFKDRGSSDCPSGEIVDPITKVCSAILCGPRWIQSKGGCQPLYQNAASLGYRLNLLAQASSVFSNLVIAKESLETRLLGVVSSKFAVPWFITSFTPIQRNRSIASVFEYHGFFVKLETVTTTKIGQDKFEKMLRDLGNASFRVDIEGNRSLPMNLRAVPVCDGQDINEFLQEGNLGKHQIFSRTDISPYEALCWSNGYRSCNVNFINLFDSPDCPYIPINLTTSLLNYDAIGNYLTIVVNDSSNNNNNGTKSIWLDPMFHVYCGGFLKVCTSYLDSIHVQQKLNQESDKQVETYMTIVTEICLSLSIICLCVTFTVFCLLPQLRSLPGKNTMALMVHLFCAQLLFLSGISATRDAVVCRVLAVLIHYFWITTFAWMGICAYYMCHLFSNLCLPSPNSNHLKSILKYHIVVHLFSMISVSTCIGLNLYISQGGHVGYGGNNVCFLSNPRDVGIFVAAPLGAILVFNIVCFAKTVVAIRAVPNMETSRNQTNRCHVDVYFRLSVLLGFTWFFGFIAAGLRNDVFWYIFIVLNGLQGVFIFLAYCFTGRTLKLLRQKFHKRSGFSILSRTHSLTLSLKNPKGNSPSHTSYENPAELLSYRYTYELSDHISRESNAKF